MINYLVENVLMLQINLSLLLAVLLKFSYLFLVCVIGHRFKFLFMEFKLVEIYFMEPCMQAFKKKKKAAGSAVVLVQDQVFCNGKISRKVDQKRAFWEEIVIQVYFSKAYII